MAIQEIRSRNNPLIKQVKQARLAKGEWRDVLLIEGKTLVDEAVKSGLESLALFIKEGIDLETIPADLKGPIYVLPNSLFEEICTTVKPQGMLLVAEGFLTPDFYEQQWNTVLYLEEIQDPGNLGTILRSAEAFGVNGVVLGSGSVNPRNEKVLRSAMGAAFRLPMVRGISIDTLRHYADERGMRIAAAEMSETSAQAYFESQRDTPLIIVIGNEARGLSSACKDLADDLISIPMAEISESLNAAVAASILLYERYRTL